MAFHVRDSETDQVVRTLARKTGMTITDAIKTAAAEKLARLEQADAARDTRPLAERIKPIQDRLAERGPTGLKADKEFYDWLSDEE
jgi:antitoxin VapB